MLKRTLILLSLAGGLFISSGQHHGAFAHQTTLAISSTISPAKIDQVLKKVSPILGISYVDACTAHQKGTLTIVEVGQNTDVYQVKFDGITIFEEIEDI